MKAKGERILVAWIGRADVEASKDSSNGLGPIGQAVEKGQYERIELLSNAGTSWPIEDYLQWLNARSRASVHRHQVEVRNPMHFGDIYEAAVHVVDPLARLPGVELTLHISPGTSAMAAVWVILGKTRYVSTAKLIQSSREAGVREVSVPFEISAELIPDLLRRPDAALVRHSEARPPEAPEFADIIRSSALMERVVRRARHVALRAVPVLIEGETGTGKELFARAIHRASPRAKKPFIALNCGALPRDLIESKLFGHAKGAFTGAIKMQPGVFEAAHGGTLFLDELGELPLDAQVKLLRVLQEGEVVRIGEQNERKVDVRVIAATHRDLLEEVAAGRFREDLFYRLAVAVLHLPALRDRKGELSMLITRLLRQAQVQLADQPEYKEKRLSSSARQLLLEHRWPGNFRELQSTLLRAALWAEGAVIGVDDVREAMLSARGRVDDGILGRTLGDGFSLEELRDEVAVHYIERALAESGGAKKRAAQLLGFNSYQTLTNWRKRLGLSG